VTAPNPWAAGRLWPGRRPRLLFGRMYEDWAAELATFPPGGRVLAVASAGDTAAALAAAGHDVTAVDINPVQLDYARARLAGAPARAGAAERLLGAGRAVAAAAVPGWRPAAMLRFLLLSDPAEQSEWWRRELDRPALRELLLAALRPAGILARSLRPGLQAAIPSRLDRLLRRRIAAGIARYPNADNPWAWRLLLGTDPTAGHLHCGQTSIHCVQTAVPGRPGSVRWVRADILDHLRAVPAGSYDAVTLSNVLDGAPAGYVPQLRAAVRHAVAPGGPVLLRTFRNGPPWPGRAVPDRSLLWGAATLMQNGD
jgi:S-adenosylmethionine:diacylglycerol 3-amino-3-carboxypropyl transferase